jgi:hypothetical protein
MTRRGTREPRPPMLTSRLPATFAEAEEREIIAAVEQWVSLIAAKLNSEATHEIIRAEMIHQLERGTGASVPIAHIIAMADAGHPAADDALRVYIHGAIDAKRFDDLPVQVQGYAMRALRRPSLPPGYPSNRSQVANDYTRDAAVGLLIDEIVRRWPQVPKFHSSRTRHSAAWLLALVFTRNGIVLGDAQVRRIYKGLQTIHQRLADFLLAGLRME